MHIHDKIIIRQELGLISNLKNVSQILTFFKFSDPYCNVLVNHFSHLHSAKYMKKEFVTIIYASHCSQLFIHIIVAKFHNNKQIYKMSGDIPEYCNMYPR